MNKELCGKPSPWPNSGPCVLEAGHLVCPFHCEAHAKKGMRFVKKKWSRDVAQAKEYTTWMTQKCGKHKTQGGQEWPIGKFNREYA